MEDTTNDVDLTDRKELENFIKESGIEQIVGAMKKTPQKRQMTVERLNDANWIMEIARSFKPIHTGLRSHYVVLVKLLDYLTDENFSGFMFIHIKNNTSILFIWKGELVGIINTKKDITDEEAFRYILGNYHDAIIDLYEPPKEKEALPLILNSLAMKELEAKYKDLDTEFTDLHKLITKLEEEKFTGYIEMKKPEGRFVSCYYTGEEALTIFLDNEQKFISSSIRKMRNENGIVNIFQSKVRTLISSMDDAMSKITVLVMNHQEDITNLHSIVNDYKGQITLHEAESARDNLDLNINLPAGLAGRDDCESFKEQVCKTPEFRFIKYFFTNYFFNIAETRNTASMKNIWYNIPRVKSIKFKQKYHEGHIHHDFDTVMEDGSGNVLFAVRHTHRPPKSYEVDVFVKELEDITEKQNEWSSLKAGFYISTMGFEEDAISSAKKATASAGVKDVLGKVGGSKVSKVLTAQKGFVRLDHDHGFHLSLIYQHEDSFEPVFPRL